MNEDILNLTAEKMRCKLNAVAKEEDWKPELRSVLAFISNSTHNRLHWTSPDLEKPGVAQKVSEELRARGFAVETRLRHKQGLGGAALAISF